MSMQWLDVLQGDITKIKADAIVNAANTELAMGSGVCGAIFRAAGVKELSAACHAIGRCPTGSAVITPAFGIKTAKFIIHAVGPVYSSHPAGEARELLRSAYRSSIRLAKRNGCESVAFPAISTGIYGYPLDDACKEAVAVCTEEAAADHIHVKLVAFDVKTAECWRKHCRSAEA
jgi:O-acetyl-ADP-ribose deacetylase